jgi:hypothetical protein
LTGLIVYQLKAKSRKVKAQEHLKPLASETWSRIQDERIWVLNLSLRSQSFETSEISVPRPSRNLNFETFSRSQFRDLLEISISRPYRDLSSETFSKSQFRGLLEISVSRPSRDLSSETFSRSPEAFSKSQFRDLLEISVSRPSRDLSSETFSRSQQEFKIQMPTTKSYLDPRRSRDG